MRDEEGVDHIKQIMQGQQVQSPTMTMDKSCMLSSIFHLKICSYFYLYYLLHSFASDSKHTFITFHFQSGM